MRCFRWHISIYTNKIKLHRPRHCKNKREQIFSYTYGALVSRISRELRAITMAFFTSGVSTANQITSLVGQNLADRPEFLRDFWSGPILASDDIREHMGEAKNGPDRRLKKPLPFFLQILKVCLLNTWLAKFWALIFIQRPFTLSVSFGFHGPPLLTFKTDRLDLRRLDPGKSDVRGSLA